jgi:hypothetical protein
MMRFWTSRVHVDGGTMDSDGLSSELRGRGDLSLEDVFGTTGYHR